MLEPGATIGIVGGGQLARMLAMAAAHLGFKTVILDPDENAPAFQVANEAIVANYADIDALSKLNENSAVITYEFENVPVDALERLPETATIHPNANALRTSQDRLVEKTFFRELGIETADFYDCPDAEALAHALSQTGGKGILKTRRFGYDGKGQVRLFPDRPDALAEAKTMVGKAPSILEAFVDFEREISIIAARNADGLTACFDPAENVHRGGILHSSTVPANISRETTELAEAIAVKTLDALGYVGVIGIEFFQMVDGALLVNEFAPRVHNSGHWTEAACAVSQFEQHIRAVAGLPLGSTLRHSDCRMENLIGDDVNRVPEILALPNTHLHLYGKAEVREGRKMGHFTTIAPQSS